MLKNILILCLVLIAGVLAYAATKPDEFRVERSIVIAAPPEAIFPLVNDLRRSREWSPWEKKDPHVRASYGPLTSGKGATSRWDGNREVGKGSLEIVESVEPSKVVMRLDFEEPMNAQSTAEFTLTPEGEGTKVTWAMHGANSFPAKVFSVFVDCETRVGAEFEKGLANLKALIEKP